VSGQYCSASGRQRARPRSWLSGVFNRPLRQRSCLDSGSPERAPSRRSIRGQAKFLPWRRSQPLDGGLRSCIVLGALLTTPPSADIVAFPGALVAILNPSAAVPVWRLNPHGVRNRSQCLTCRRRADCRSDDPHLAILSMKKSRVGLHVPRQFTCQRSLSTAEHIPAMIHRRRRTRRSSLLEDTAAL
jgi:hypothetical protein